MKRLVLLLVIVFVAMGAVQAQTERDEDNWDIEYLKKEFRDNLKRAQAGDARAMFEVGLSYESGIVVAKNLDETIKWWSKAADLGNTSALFNLASLYSSERVGTFDMYKGKEIPKNPDEAFWLWKILGEQKETPAGMYHLGNCYWYGEGVGRSYKEAVKWWQKSARKDFKQAQEALKKIDETW